MMNVAIWGRGREHGHAGLHAGCARTAEYKVLCVEPLPAGVERLKARGDAPSRPTRPPRVADMIVLAIADKFIKPVAADLVPRMKPGAMLLMLDPAAAYAGDHPRAGRTSPSSSPTRRTRRCSTTRPTRRPAATTSARARQSSRSSTRWCRAPRATTPKGEAVARAYFSPILRSHRVTLEQMAILEPAMSETCSATFIVAMKEAMEEAIVRGVPREAAFDFLMGHINVQLAIVFEQIDWKMSEGAYHVIDKAMKRIFRPDWKGVFDREELKASVRGICNV